MEVSLVQKFKLDFNIYSIEDRMEAIRKIPLDTLTPTELETVSNYVLYGKDADGTSAVDRKEIQIKTKFNSYNKQKFVSLDEMMESPTFDENILQKDNTKYKKVKPTIDKEKAATIPGMKLLWEEIEKMQHVLDRNSGKEEWVEGTPKLSTREQYYLKHHLIQLRTQQYYLMDSYYPTIMAKKNKGEYHEDQFRFQMSYPIFPRGTCKSENDLTFQQPYYDDTAPARAADEEQIEKLKKEGKPYFDFRDENHLYYLILHYQDLSSWIEDYPEAPLWELLWTLDFYIEKAKLSEQQRLIVEGKKAGLSNKDIRIRLNEELGIDHQVNYISTIWKKAVGLIVEAVELNYDEYLCKDYKKAWKKCRTCGEMKLKDSRNFVRKTKSTDGFTNRCKVCDAKKRKGLL